MRISRLFDSSYLYTTHGNGKLVNVVLMDTSVLEERVARLESCISDNIRVDGVLEGLRILEREPTVKKLA